MYSFLFLLHVILILYVARRTTEVAGHNFARIAVLRYAA